MYQNLQNRLDQQDKYIGKAVTLNGEPAKIVRNGDFADVAPLDTSKGAVPFSWTAIYNICDNHNGEF